MRMNVIFAYFSVCSFVHVQKMNGPVPRMGTQKSALYLFLFRLKTLSLSCKLLRPRCGARAVCIIINNSLNVLYNGRTIYTQTLSEKT